MGRPPKKAAKSYCEWQLLEYASLNSQMSA